MKKLYCILFIIFFLLFVTACGITTESEQLEESQNPNMEVEKELGQTPQDIDLWFDFSDTQPILNDAGDAETYDIKRVFVANDDDFLYFAFEVLDEGHIDSTTMIRAGAYYGFTTIDMPSYFSVTHNDIVYADSEGNGDYYGIAAYKYEDGLLQFKLPLAIYEGATDFTINTLFREKDNGAKFEVDIVDDFAYTLL